jgi:Uracil-DNA glycosylase
MNDPIEQLVAQLAAQPVAEDCTNQYAPNGDPGQDIRRANLTRYLRLAIARKPDLLLLGEAPGYLGCRRTGIPFTSDKILLAASNEHVLFGSAYGYQHASNDGRMPGEQTATIVWRCFAQHDLIAIGWNAYPFHPHRPGQPNSNRTPRASELKQGLPFLQSLLQLLDPNIPLVAMGNSAARNLEQLGLPYRKVRHPAQGGARQFEAGIAEIAASLKASHHAGH